MTLKSDIHKVTLDIADLQRGYFARHKLTVARHPSETEERLMLRLIAFAMNASEGLHFHGELCNQDEPELCELELDGRYRLWVEFGLADERRIKRACQRASLARVYAYGGRDLAQWWQQLQGKCAQYQNLSVIAFDNAALTSLLPFAARTMDLAVNIDEDGGLELSDGQHEVSISPDFLQPRRAAPALAEDD
ncbi:YaeQ family protein [Shewanella sp. JM162201]|uniref:YaeQ family protein n=1 Tax=Shewanella jiangmenensis TaxID=2837387 RepID=A0ABS5V790_9GAMM|nr:YaeQ family protein [Shewanella jiangmenensis]MBT1446304.1 YaeQ family protein [Shewanella jiangmenensis]